MSGRHRDHKTTSQSLLSALNRFVHAVDSMEDTVMIPSRLKDVQVPREITPPQGETEQNLNPVVEGSDLFECYSLINSIKSELMSGPIKGEEGFESDVSSECSDDSEDSTASDTCRKTADEFRYHLQGLFGLLHQLTGTAKFITNKYENEVEQMNRSIGSKNASFTI